MSEFKQQIIPMLSYENGINAMEWLCRVFGFSEKTKMLNEDGSLAHGEIAMGDSIIMLSTPGPDYQSPLNHRKHCLAAEKSYQVPYIINGMLVFVNNLRAHFEKSKASGATILSEIETGGPGDRYRAEDLEGQRWMFMAPDQ